jgi:hypothetical protein
MLFKTLLQLHWEWCHNTLQDFFRDFLSTLLTFMLSHQCSKDMHTSCFWSSPEKLVWYCKIRLVSGTGQARNACNARNKSAGELACETMVCEQLLLTSWCLMTISMEYRLAGKWVFKFKILSRGRNLGFVQCIAHVCRWDTRQLRAQIIHVTARLTFRRGAWLKHFTLPIRLPFPNHYHHASHTDGISDSLTWFGNQ